MPLSPGLLYGRDAKARYLCYHHSEPTSSRQSCALKETDVAAEPLYLTMLRQGDTVIADLTEVDPLVPRCQIRIEEQLLTDIGAELARITALANTRAVLGGLGASGGREATSASYEALRRLGALIFSHLFPEHIRQQLARAAATDLFLRLDDQLVHVPWELAFDGEDFLLAKFRIGRQVITQQRPAMGNTLRPQDTTSLKMLVIADPTETLPAAAEEAEQLCELLDSCEHLEVSMLGGKQLRKLDLLQALNEHDVVHYAGHAYFDADHPDQSGWVLHDAVLTAAELSRLPAAPRLVFANACQAGVTTRWQAESVYEGQAFGIGSAFLLAGTENYLGTFCIIHDTHSVTFAADFYRHLLQGARVGEALARARYAARQRPESGLLWASYMHYGNPLYRLPLCSRPDMPNAAENASTLHQELQPQDDPRSSQEPGGRGLAPEPALSRGIPTTTASPARPRPLWQAPGVLGTAALLLLCLGLAVFWRSRPGDKTAAEMALLTPAYWALERGDWQRAETLLQRLDSGQNVRTQSQRTAGLAAVALARGETQQALTLAAQAESLDPEVADSYVVRGLVFVQQGKLTEAVTAYHTATTKSHGSSWQQAMAANLLGRLYTVQGQAQQALEQYDKALHYRQDMAVVYANKAHVLAQIGQRQEALALYRQAVQVDPNDTHAAALLREAEHRQVVATDQSRQERLDRLVAELLQAHRQPDRSAPVSDGWTSPLLTLALLPVQQKGTIAARAGEAEAIQYTLLQTLAASGRLQVVEREVLDKLLAELKLSTSELVETQTALRVGKILSARLLATVSWTRSGATGQLSLRLIETETTRVRAAVTDNLDNTGTLHNTVERLAHTLLHKLHHAYPLQGRIVGLAGERVMLNLGTEHGLKPGLRMQVFGEEEALVRNGTIVGQQRLPVGMLEVISTEERLSQARVVEHLLPLQAGWQVKEVFPQP